MKTSFEVNTINTTINTDSHLADHFSSICWMKNWMEQSISLKNKPNAAYMIEMDLEEFCHYEDVTHTI